MARALDGAIAELAPKTLGLLTTAQLDALGVTRQQRRTLIRRGVLVPVAPGLVRHAACPTTWKHRVLAAVLAAGEGAAASHMTAAALWRFDGVGAGAVEVTVPHGRRPRGVPGTLHRTLDLPRADVVRRGPVVLTTPSRTFLDIASRLEPRRLEEVLDGAERDGTIWRPHLEWRIHALRCSGRPGIPAVVALLARTEGRPLGDSWLEQEAIRVIVRSGLPTPRAQVRRRTHGGGISRVDLFWDGALLVAELAGHSTHATRRQRQGDAERTARLGLTGCRVVQFTYEDVVERPQHIVDVIRAYLAQA